MPSAKTMDLELLLVPEARLVFTVKSFNGAGGVVLGLGGHAQKKKTGCHGANRGMEAKTHEKPLKLNECSQPAKKRLAGGVNEPSEGRRGASGR